MGGRKQGEPSLLRAPSTPKLIPLRLFTVRYHDSRRPSSSRYQDCRAQESRRSTFSAVVEPVAWERRVLMSLKRGRGRLGSQMRSGEGERLFGRDAGAGCEGDGVPWTSAEGRRGWEGSRAELWEVSSSAERGARRELGGEKRWTPGAFFQVVCTALHLSPACKAALLC